MKGAILGTILICGVSVPVIWYADDDPRRLTGPSVFETYDDPCFPEAPPKPHPVPIPGTLILIATGLLGLRMIR